MKKTGFGRGEYRDESVGMYIEIKTINSEIYIDLEVLNQMKGKSN